jgi:hypothetical protein
VQKLFGTSKQKPAAASVPKTHDHYIFKGLTEDVEKAIKYVEGLYNIDDAHMTHMVLAKQLPDDVLKEL